MSAPVVQQEIDNRGIATVALNRPDVNNAYNGELIDSLLSLFGELAANDKVRVVVIKGNGRHFQAGADLSWINSVRDESPAENLRVSQQTAALVRGLNEFPKPTVALIHGACIGGGTGVAAACDIVLASSDAFFAISEARWGLAAQIIFPQLNAAIGARNVRRYALTCERFDAATACRIGLVHQVCETGQLEATAAPILEGLLLAAPEAVAATKRSVLECAGDIMSDSQFEALSEQHAAKRQTPEAREGLASFIEKRHPGWFTPAA